MKVGGCWLSVVVAALQAAASSGLELEPIDDAYTRGGTHADLTKGLEGQFVVKQTPSNANLNRRSFLKFDFSSVVVPPDQVVTSVTLRLCIRGGNTNQLVSLHVMDDTSWNEATITWNNMPPAPYGALLDSDVISGIRDEWGTWDVTSHVTSLIASNAAGVVSFALLPDDTNQYSTFYSKEQRSAARRPYLDIQTETVVSTEAPTPAPSTSSPTTSPSKSPTTAPSTSPSSTPSDMPTAAPVAAPVTMSMNAVQDAYTRDGSRSDNNYGDDFRLDVKNSPTVGDSRQSLVQFDLAGVTGVVTSASVTLKVYGNRDVDVANQICAVDTTTAWDENTVTWNTKPVVGAVLDTQVVGAALSRGDAVTFDVTSQLNVLLQQGQLLATFAIVDQVGVDELIKYYAKEDASSVNWPQLTVTYVPGVTNTAAPVTPSPTPAPTDMPTLAPSVSNKPSSTPTSKTVDVEQDAYTTSGSGASNIFGQTDSDRLVVVGDSSSETSHAFVQVDLRGINGPVNSAILTLYERDDNPTRPSGSTVVHDVHAVEDTAWDQNALTWNTQPALGALLDTQLLPATGPAAAVVQFDVTEFVDALVQLKDEQDGSPYNHFASFAIVAATGSDPYSVAYHSLGGPTATHPRVTFTYSPSFEPPYDTATPQLQALLDVCRLQAPTSSNAAVNNRPGEFAGFADWFFHKTAPEGYLRFAMGGAGSARSELRHANPWEGWPTSSSTPKTLSARLRIDDPGATFGHFSFVQIHSNDFVGYEKGPLLRVTWRANTEGQIDHLWAVFRTSLAPKDTNLFDLGPRPEGFFDIEVTVVSRTLTIKINNVATNAALNGYDLTYWDPIPGSHFKTGAYLSGDWDVTKTAVVEYESLSMTGTDIP